MTALAIWTLAKRLWPVFAALAVLLAVWGYGNHRAHSAKMTERAEWHVELDKAKARAAIIAARQQAAVNAANTAASAAQTRLDALAGQSKETARVYYKSRPVVRCLDPERLRAISESDRAATAASTSQ